MDISDELRDEMMKFNGPDLVSGIIAVLGSDEPNAITIARAGFQALVVAGEIETAFFFAVTNFVTAVKMLVEGLGRTEREVLNEISRATIKRIAKTIMEQD